jgi:hypothetical protein
MVTFPHSGGGTWNLLGTKPNASLSTWGRPELFVIVFEVTTPAEFTATVMETLLPAASGTEPDFLM